MAVDELALARRLLIANGWRGFEIGDREAAGPQAAVGPYAGGDDLYGHIRTSGCIDQVTDLLLHDVPSADGTAQHRLVNDRPQGWRIVASQDLPSLDAGCDLLFDFLFRHAEAGPEDGSGVVLGLEQAGNQQRAEPTELLGFALAY